MIIKKDDPSNLGNNFEQRFNALKEGAKKIDSNNILGSNQNHYTDVLSKNDMTTKSFNMLQERLKNGQITLEEFNKQCERLRKLERK